MTTKLTLTIKVQNTEFPECESKEVFKPQKKWNGELIEEKLRELKKGEEKCT